MYHFLSLLIPRSSIFLFIRFLCLGIGILSFNMGCSSESDSVAPGAIGNACTNMNQRICDGICVNTFTDPLNCGECGRACADGLSCMEGVCTTLGCGMNNNEAMCEGACVDLQNNPNHCGGCNQSCGESAQCQVGNCQCNEGLNYCLSQ